MLALSVLGVVACDGGCIAFTAPGPVGPLRSGEATQLSAAWSYAYGPATATVSGMAVKGNAEAQAAGADTPQLPSIAPVTVGVRQTIGDGAELSADLGWIDSGLRLRMGMTDAASAPIDVVLEARTGEVAAFPTASYQASLAFEIYPSITPAQGYSQRRLILSLGLAGGVFQHQLSLPFAFEPDFDLPFGGPTMTVLRPELRVQTGVGVYLGGAKSGLSIVVAPWLLLGAGSPSSFACKGCDTATTPALTSYAQSWGASLIVTPSYGWLHGR